MWDNFYFFYIVVCNNLTIIMNNNMNISKYLKTLKNYTEYPCNSEALWYTVYHVSYTNAYPSHPYFKDLSMLSFTDSYVWKLVGNVSWFRHVRLCGNSKLSSNLMIRFLDGTVSIPVQNLRRSVRITSSPVVM